MNRPLYQRHRASGAILVRQAGLVFQVRGDGPVNDTQHLTHRLRAGDDR